MNTCICIYACLFICRHQRTLRRLTQLWTIQPSAHPRTYSGKQGFTCSCIIVLIVETRASLSKKEMFISFLIHFFLHFPLLLFPEVKLSHTIYSQTDFIFIIPTVNKVQGVYRCVCLSVCPSICADSCPAHYFFLVIGLPYLEHASITMSSRFDIDLWPEGQTNRLYVIFFF